MLIQQLPVAKYLSINIILWGVVLALHAACTNFATILVARTVLGIFEAVCQPAFLTMSSMWYKRSEQASIITFWFMMNGTQQIVGGLLAYCFSLIRSGPVKGYQALFMTYGILSVLWGVFVLIWLPDSPMRAHCFSEDDKKLMVERVRSNQTGLQNKKWRKEQFIEALTDVQTWGYCLVSFTTTLPTSGLGAFANIIITSFNFTVLQTQLLAMVLGVVIIVILLSSTWIANKTQQTLIVMGVYVIPSVAGTVVLLSVKNTGKASQIGLLFSYYIVLSFWAAQTLSMTLISRNIAGQTKKMVVTAMYFVTGCVGNAIGKPITIYGGILTFSPESGPQVFLDWNKPRYFIAFATHMVCYAVLILDILFLRWYLKLQNTRKSRSQGLQHTGGEDVVQAFGDFTDKENKSFRYVF
jgi:MFS family permease